MKEQFGFAVCSDSDTYHLFDVRSSFTLCGLSATPKSQTGTSAVDLQVIADAPQHARLCRHCDDAVDANSSYL